MRACRTVVCASFAMALLAMPAAQAQEEMEASPEVPERCKGLTGSALKTCIAGDQLAKITDDDDTAEQILQYTAAVVGVILIFSLLTGDDDEDSTSFGPATRQARPLVEFAPIYDPDSNMLMARGRIRF